MPGNGERPEPPAELVEALQAKITELDTRDAAGCFDSLDTALRFFGGNLFKLNKNSFQLRMYASTVLQIISTVSCYFYEQISEEKW